MSSNARTGPFEFEEDEGLDCSQPACSLPRMGAVQNQALSRAGSFSNLDEDHESLQFPRDENISAKIDEVFIDFFFFLSCFGTMKLTCFGIRQLSSDDVNVVASAAEYLFEKAHSSNPRSEQNKMQMGRDGAILDLAILLDRDDDNIRYQALSALSEIAFRDSWNCNAIARTHGLLERLAELLHPDAGVTQ